MEAAELKAMQAPLKDTYCEDAGKALITLRAKAELSRCALISSRASAS